MSDKWTEKEIRDRILMLRNSGDHVTANMLEFLLRTLEQNK